MMPKNPPDIVVEERYRTRGHYLELAMLSAFCVPIGAVAVLAVLHGLEQIAWPMYLFYAPIFAAGLVFFGQLVCLALAIIRDTRGVLLVDDQQLILNTAYCNKTIPLRDVTAVDEAYKKLGGPVQLGLLIRVKHKGYHFFPHELSSEQVSELIYLIEQMARAARRREVEQ